MLYTILIIIAVLLYLIYRSINNQTAEQVSPAAKERFRVAMEEAKNTDKEEIEAIKKIIDQNEAKLIDSLKILEKNSFSVVLYECGKANFLNLIGPYKKLDDFYSNKMFKDIANMWASYLEALDNDILFWFLMTYEGGDGLNKEELDKIKQKLNEVEKYFKNLLGNVRYRDPRKMV